MKRSEFEVWLSKVFSQASSALEESSRILSVIESVDQVLEVGVEDGEDDGDDDDGEGYLLYTQVRHAMSSLSIADEDMGLESAHNV